jgi:hypothetical protein
MRTLTDTLLAAQRLQGTTPRLRLTLSKTGETDVVLEQDRILAAFGIDSPGSQKTNFVFQNASQYFNSLDYKGWTAVLERGMITTAGAEYDAMPPMKVMEMGGHSGPGSLTCPMTLFGIPDLLNLDKASKDYFNHWSNAKTVKTLLTEIASGVAVDTELTEQQTVTDDFVTMPITVGTTDLAGTVKTTAAVGINALAINSLGTGQITRGTTLTIAGDSTVYTVKNTVAISGNETIVTLTEGLAAQATAGAVVTLAAEVGTRTVTGVALTITNHTVTKLSFYLKKVGAPSGTNVTFKVSQDDGGSNLASATFAIASIGTSAAWCEATLATPLLVNERVWLTVEYTGGDASNYICVGINSTQLKANEAFVSDAVPDAAAAPDVSWEDAAQSCGYKYKYTAGTGVTNGVDCFTHCTAYTVVYDSEDSLIDTYIPAAGFQIVQGMSRLEVLDTLLRFTTCVRKFSADGKIHIFVPVIAGTTYAYQYALNVAGTHQMLAKSVRNALVVPNKITVKSYTSDTDQYSGSATDATSFAILPIETPIKAYLASNAQGNSIATAMIAQAVMAAQAGSASVPINLGAEPYDYIKVTDSRANDSRTGNQGQMRWSYIPGKEYIMNLSLGPRLSAPISGNHSTPSYDRPITVQELADFTYELNDDLKSASDSIDYLMDTAKEDTTSAITVASIAAQIVAALVGYLKNVVEDTTPQLGGDLDLNGKNIDFPTTANISDCLDEDNMASNSATKLATQQSIKAYVDAHPTGISNVVEDTSPQLGGTLDVNSRTITGIICTRSVITGNVSVGASYTNSTAYPIMVEFSYILEGYGASGHINIGGYSTNYFGIRLITLSGATTVTDVHIEGCVSFILPVGGSFTPTQDNGTLATSGCSMTTIGG